MPDALGAAAAAWLWVGSQVDYKTGSVALGIVVAFAGMLTTLFMTLALAAPARLRLEARPGAQPATSRRRARSSGSS